MPLTPQDVHSKVFGPTRFRRGYDEGEVDAFLDEVEAELLRLHRELDSLRSGGFAANGAPATSLTKEGAAEGHAAANQPLVPEGSPSGVVLPSARHGQPPNAEGGPGELEHQVARTLVLAQRAADEAMRDAETEAEQLRRAAQAEVERWRREAHEQAERERLELERTRSRTEDDVEQLRAFEREYRTRLRAYLEHQLRELDEGPAEVEGRSTASLAAGTPAELGSATSEEGDSGLLTTGLGWQDPATVPPVGPSASSSAVPASVPVDDYESATGVSDQSPGDEWKHESRDLHDDM
jgi:DivIVA domain-containing protein